MAKDGKGQQDHSGYPSSEPGMSLLMLKDEKETELSVSAQLQYHPTQRPPHLGAEGIPGSCPQLVSLGLCHICSLLSIIQLMLGLAILSQVGAGLLLLEA